MPKTRVACLQLKAREIDEAAEALDDALAAVDLAAGEGAQIIVLPEMTYPAYLLYSRQAYKNAVGSEAAVLSAFGARARRHGIVIAAGMGISRGDEIENAAVLFGPDGNEIGRYQKSFLWHFDRKWFAPGAAYPAFDTPFGRVGILICADSRVPEIARALAINGAEIILDVTAWVSAGRTFDALYSPQVDYMMPVRALECGLPVAAANKWGVEAGSIVYAGQSCVLDAEGKPLAIAPTEGDSCIVADLELAPATPPMPRRPDLYTEVAKPTDTLPVARLLTERMSMDTPAPRVAVVQLQKAATADDFLTSARRIVRAMAVQDTQLLLFPDASSILDDRDARALSDLSVEFGDLLLGFTVAAGHGDGRRRELVVLSAGAAVFRYAQAHFSAGDLVAGWQPGRQLSPVVETAAGRFGAMIGDEGLVPEVARCLMLRGADLVLWPVGPSKRPLLPVARSRADENRVYVAMAGPSSPATGAVIVAPSGAVLASAPTTIDVAVGAAIQPALSRWKELVPGTHVVHSRRPETYGALLEG